MVRSHSLATKLAQDCVAGKENNDAFIFAGKETKIASSGWRTMTHSYSLDRKPAKDRAPLRRRTMVRPYSLVRKQRTTTMVVGSYSLVMKRRTITLLGRKTMTRSRSRSRSPVRKLADDRVARSHRRKGERWCVKNPSFPIPKPHSKPDPDQTIPSLQSKAHSLFSLRVSAAVPCRAWTRTRTRTRASTWAVHCSESLPLRLVWSSRAPKNGANPSPISRPPLPLILPPPPTLTASGSPKP